MNQQTKEQKNLLIKEQQQLTDTLLDKIAEAEYKTVTILKNILIATVAGIVAYAVFRIFFAGEETKETLKTTKQEKTPILPPFLVRWLQENIGIFLLELLKNKLLAYLEEKRQKT